MKWPCVAVLGCGDVQPQFMIDLLAENAQVEVMGQGPRPSYVWNVDTKYYTARVNIRAVERGAGHDEDAADCVEAVVVCFDGGREDGLADVEDWRPFLEDTQPDVKLLVTDRFSEDAPMDSRARATEWCMKNGFELIDLKPPAVSEADPQDTQLIKETSGVDRVLEALQTHLWSNMAVKGGRSEPGQPSTVDRVLDNLLSDDDQLEFGELFQKLHSLKESVQSMPVQERRQCAEQVVAAFWRAIGGDDDELGDL